MSGQRRSILIAAGVLVFHVFALWALHNGLLQRAVELLVPVQMISEIIELPRPAEAPPPVIPPPPVAVKRPAAKPTPPRPAPAPELQATPNPDPAPNAPTAVATPPAPLPPITAPMAVAAAPVAPPPALAPPAPPRIELPSSDAAYLRNPKPIYPPLSRRRGEEGEVLVELVVAADGTAQKVGIRKSSGFDRLDQSALEAVRNWRFVPGKRAGIPEAMPYVVLIPFKLVPA